MLRRRVVPATLLAVALALAGCALYSDVAVAPLSLTPSNIDRGTDIHSMLRKADFARAIELTPLIESRARQNPSELAALGAVYLAAGRLDDARKHLRAAIDLDPFRTTHAQVAWDLSQVEYLANNFEASLEWALVAKNRGLSILPWHIDYIRSLGDVPVYRFSGSPSERVPLRFGRPDVPRLETRLNGRRVEGILDSGAVLSIVSARMAEALDIRRLGTFEGTFYGLLGEPIPVSFGLLDTLELGAMLIRNVPVAIMPDEKMRFLLSRREGTEFHMDFLLGAHLLKEFRIELNFDRHAITFTRLTAADRRPDLNQNLFFHGFRPHVQAAVNKKGWFLFLLDTGSEITFLNESRVGALPVHVFGSSMHTATVQGLGGAMKRGSKIENVEIGVDRWGGTFKTLPMYWSRDTEVSVGIVGQNFLRHFNVVIDFGRMRVDLERR
jgi:hypothetical protein